MVMIVLVLSLSTVIMPFSTKRSRVSVTVVLLAPHRLISLLMLVTYCPRLRLTMALPNPTCLFSHAASISRSTHLLNLCGVVSQIQWPQMARYIAIHPPIF